MSEMDSDDIQTVLDSIRDGWDDAKPGEDRETRFRHWMKTLEDYSRDRDADANDIFADFLEIRLLALLDNYNPPKAGDTLAGSSTSYSAGANVEPLEVFIRVMGNDAHIRVCFENALMNQKKHLRSAQTEIVPTRKEKQEISRLKWVKVAIDLMTHHPQYIIPIVISDEKGDPTQNLWKDEETALHVAVTQSCPEVVERLLQLVRKQHSKYPSRGERAILSQKRSDQTALAIAVDQLDLKSVKKLLSATKRFLEFSSGRGGYPLHDLVLSVANPTKKHSDMALSESWLILAEIIEADTELALTSKCGLISTTPWSQTINDIPPYTCAALAEEGMKDVRRRPSVRNSQSANNIDKRIPILQRLRIDMKTYIVRALDGTTYEQATYGDLSLQNKITYLDLSDFDSIACGGQENDLERFVKNFKPRPNCFEFSDMLSYVRLPDISIGDPDKTTQAILSLFNNLAQLFKVVKIVKLEAKDNPIHPIDDSTIAQIVDRFNVEELDWVKYNMDLDPLRCKTSDSRTSSLRKLTLYSTGHWGVLHHWTSEEGIYSFKELKEVMVIFIDPYDTHELPIRDSRVTLIEVLKRTRRRGDAFRRDEANKLNIGMELGQPHKPRIRANYVPESVSDLFFKAFEHIQSYVLDVPFKLELDDDRLAPLRSKVAIIDNGVDIGQSSIASNIRRGRSFVSLHHNGWYLPWFTSVHVHGTQMASLVVRVDPQSDLFIYRINSLPSGSIDAKHAIEAIEAAVEDKVDIINLSWSFNKNMEGLRDAIDKATEKQHRALVLCAKSDELYADDVFPADYLSTISVAAATSRGRIGTEGSKAPDLLILGENMPADGPNFLKRVGKEESKISGSSVATALASGIASMMLMLAKRDVVLKESWELLKIKEVMLGVFERFKTDKSSKVIYVNPALIFGDEDRLIFEMRSVVKSFPRANY